ncbi:MAG: hypothetical protein RRB13_01560 [bacterium]|nr:hypothetical protein [bacterium]
MRPLIVLLWTSGWLAQPAGLWAAGGLEPELEPLRQGFLSSNRPPNDPALARLEHRLAPLAQRLEAILAAPKPLASQNPLGQSNRLYEALDSTLKLGQQDPSLQQNPKGPEVLALLEASLAAQARVGQSLKSQQPEPAARQQSEVQQAVAAALRLLQQPKQPPQDSPKQDSEHQTPPDQGQSGDSKQPPQDSAQKEQKPSSGQKSPPEEAQNTPSSQADQEGHPGDQQAQQMKAKEALKRLLRLQKESADAKADRRERMGLYRGGSQPVEKDW